MTSYTPTATSNHNTIIWTGWTTSATNSTTSITVPSIWTGWCDNSTAATTITASRIWVTWCDNTAAPAIIIPRPDPQQLEALERSRAEATQRYMETERKRAAAEARAEQLLLENLTLAQRLQYEQSKSFVVHGREGRRFRIRHGRSGNVDVVGRDGRISQRLCAHPSVLVPNADTMLAQKLMLEHDEEQFMRLANRHAVLESAPVLEPLH